jgi:hypothetical protein
MESNLSKDQKKTVQKWLSEAKDQKKTIDKWLTGEDKKLKILEDFMGQPVESWRATIDIFRQCSSKLDEQIKNLEEHAK